MLPDRNMARRFAPFVEDLWQHRALLWQFTQRQVELRHKGSHLGLLWSFLNPLLMFALYVAVFGYIFQGSFGRVPDESRIDYALGIFLGLTLFHFFAETLATAPALVVNNPNFVKKVVFPLEILPAASVASAVFHLLISLALVLAGIAFVGRGLPLSLLWLPVIVLPIVMLALGTSYLLSGLGVFFRDIGQVVAFVSTALLWASGVFYTAQKYPEAWPLLRFNPLLLGIELARDAALWARPVNLHHLAYLYAAGGGLWLGGHFAFRRLKPAFADVL